MPRLPAGLDALTRLSPGEGLPRVVVEVGAVSLAVVAARDRGTEEQLDDGLTGLVVPHEAPAVVAAALARLIEDPGPRRAVQRERRPG